MASPTLAAQIGELLQEYPAAKWVQWEPFGRDNAREGSRLAFGEYVTAQYAVEKADVILTLDADLLCTGAAGIRHARAFASRRRVEGDASKQNRLYAVESSPTNTGTKADHRLLIKPTQVEAFARAVASQLGIAGAGRRRCRRARRSGSARSSRTCRRPADAASWWPVMASRQSCMHWRMPSTTRWATSARRWSTRTRPKRVPTNQLASLRELVGEMNAGTVEFLLIISANPVYSAPSDLKFADAMQKVAIRAHVGLYEDETAALCHWHIPEAHYLEAWSDVRTDDGTVTIVQPLIAPLYSGKSAHEIIAAIGPTGERTAYDLVRDYWMRQGCRTGIPAPQPEAPKPAPAAAPAPPVDRRRAVRHLSQRRQPGAAPAGGGEPRRLQAPPPLRRPPAPSAFDTAWRKWLHDGMIPNTAFPAEDGRGAGRLRAPAGGRRQSGARSRVPSGSERVGRPVREQCVAAGTAQAAHQADVGQRGVAVARRPPIG